MTDGERIYASFGSRGVFCYNLAGKPLWKRDLGRMQIYNSFGEGTSPVIAGDSLVVGDAGNGVTLLNVWATWCTSCREEFAELERLRVTHSSQGLRVVGVSVDQGTDLKVRKFVEAQQTNFSVAHDAESRITSMYGVGGLPTSYLLDASGKVLWRAVGDFRLDSAGLANAIRAALP